MDFVYQEIADRLLTCPTYKCHNPLCFCEEESICPDIVTCRLPNEWALQPLQDYNEITKHIFKKKLASHMLGEAKTKKEPNIYCFLTINPHNKVEFIDFLTKFQKQLKTELFTDYLGVIEQRGATDETCGEGFHAHILFKRHTPLNQGLPPSNIERNFRDTWKNYTDTKNSEIFNFKWIPESWGPDKKSYMLEQKTGPGKSSKQIQDRNFRKKFNLTEYYGNIDIC